jgi:Dynamin family
LRQPSTRPTPEARYKLLKVLVIGGQLAAAMLWSDGNDLYFRRWSLMLTKAQAQPPEKLDSWLREATDLAERFGLADISTSLHQLRMRTTRSRFRLCVSGASSSGKSQLINQLLGRDVLPVGIAASQSVPVLVRGAWQSYIEVIRAGMPPERHVADASSWSRLASESTAELCVYLDSPWLREHEVELIEAPEYDTTNQAPVNVVKSSLTGSDAVMLVTRAAGGFNRGEQDFIKDVILGEGRVGRLLVIVSNLDNLGGGEHEPVLSRIGDLAAHMSPMPDVITVLPGPGGTSAVPSDSERLAEIRDAIERLANRHDRRARRAWQVAALLLRECGHLISAADEAISNRSLNQQVTEQTRLLLENKVAQKDPTWDLIRADLERRRLAVAGELRESLEAQREPIITSLLLKLDADDSDPKFFWERQFPDALRSELSRAADSRAHALAENVADDAAWLERTVVQVGRQGASAPAAGRNVATSALVPRAGSAGASDVPPLELADLKLRDAQRVKSSVRIGSRVGLTAAGAVAAALFSCPPLSPLGELGGDVGDVLYRQWIEGQREKIRPALRNAVDTAIREHVRAVLDATKRAYAELVESTLAAQRSRATDGLTVAADPDPEPVPWDELLDAATGLRERITRAIATSNERAEQ